MVIRISDKTQNYSKVTKLLVKPTEILISDFNEGMNIGMVQKNDSSFSFNS